jgi:hypothetical protein
MNWKTVLVGAVAALLGASTAAAGGVQFGLNIDVQDENIVSGVPFPTYGAASGQAGQWNVVGTSPGTTALLNLDGSPSGVLVENVGGGASEGFCVSGLSVPWQQLMCDQQANSASIVNAIRYDFRGLPVGVYDVYVYACAPGEDTLASNNMRIDVGGVFEASGSTSGDVLNQVFEQGRTHDVLRITVDEPGELVTLTMFAGSGEFGSTAYLNGIQIVRLDGLTAAIDDPGQLEPVCNPVLITGTADGPGFGSYTLEYSQSGNDPWTLITSSTTPVTSGLLGTWDTTGLAEGPYTIRLTTQGGSVSETSVRTVLVNQVFDTVDVETPVENGVYGGIVCFDGTVWDEGFDTYSVIIIDGDGNQYVTDPNNPFYINPVINDLLTEWNSTFFPDGQYTFEVVGRNKCGSSKQVTGEIVVDNTPPEVGITSPTECNSVCDILVIEGFVFDENIESWTLQYSGGGAPGWTTIATGTDNIEGVLAEWDVSNLPGCCYALRLVAVDSADVNCGNGRNRTEVVATTCVGNPLDVNRDGLISGQDLAAVLGAWGAACP